MRRAIQGPLFCLVTSLLVAAPAELAAASQRYDCNPADGSFKTVDKRAYRHLPSGSTGVYADIKNKTKTWRTKVRGQVCFYDAHNFEGVRRVRVGVEAFGP